MLGGNAARTNRGDYNAATAGTGDLAAGRQREPEIGHIAVRHLALIPRILLVRCLSFVWQRAERQRHGFTLPTVNDAELDALAWRHGPDLAGKLARIVDGRIID